MPLVSTLLALHRRLYIAGAEYNHKVYEVDWILNVLNAETKPIQGVGKGVLPKKSKGRQASHPTVRLVSTGACLVAVTVRTNTCSQRKTRSPTILCSNEQKYDVLSSPSLRLCFTDAALRNPDKLYPLFLLLLLLLYSSQSF